MRFKFKQVPAIPLILLATLFIPSAGAEETHMHAVRDKIASATRAPMPPWALPELERYDLDPRLRLWLLEDRTLPVAELLFQFPYGSFQDPDGEEGRSALMIEAWRQGGTERYSPDAFAALLARYAIDIDIDLKKEYALISLRALKGDLARALLLFDEWFFHPAFDAGRFLLAKRQAESGLVHIKDYPEAIGSYLYPSIVYGEKSKWGRRLHLSDLKRLSRDNALAAYREFLRAGPVLVGARGDLKKSDLLPFAKRFSQALALQNDGTIHAGSTGASAPPLMSDKKWSAGVTLLVKEGDQSTLFAGHLGERRFNPDRFALLLANYMLGGDPLGSLLALEIRNERGLVYDIGSSYGFETDYGLFIVEAKTAAAHTALVLSLVKDRLKALVKAGEGLSPERLALAKRAFLSDLLFTNERKGNLLRTLMRFEFYGYGDRYLERFAREIEAVTLECVKEVIPRYFSPEQLTVLIVGPEALKDQLGPWRPTRVFSTADSVK